MLSREPVIVARAGEEIVDAQHDAALGKEPLAKVGPEEPGAACHERGSIS